MVAGTTRPARWSEFYPSYAVSFDERSTQLTSRITSKGIFINFDNFPSLTVLRIRGFLKRSNRWDLSSACFPGVAEATLFDIAKGTFKDTMSAQQLLNVGIEGRRTSYALASISHSCDRSSLTVHLPNVAFTTPFSRTSSNNSRSPSDTSTSSSISL